MSLASFVAHATANGALKKAAITAKSQISSAYYIVFLKIFWIFSFGPHSWPIQTVPYTRNFSQGSTAILSHFGHKSLGHQ
jgi:hypothetical protein